MHWITWGPNRWARLLLGGDYSPWSKYRLVDIICSIICPCFFFFVVILIHLINTTNNETASKWICSSPDRLLTFCYLISRLRYIVAIKSKTSGTYSSYFSSVIIFWWFFVKNEQCSLILSSLKPRHAHRVANKSNQTTILYKATRSVPWIDYNLLNTGVSLSDCDIS